jgi:hypothetical protein
MLPATLDELLARSPRLLFGDSTAWAGYALVQEPSEVP